MTDEPDYELIKDEAEVPPEVLLAPRRPVLWPIAVLAVIAVSAAAYFWLNPLRPVPPATVERPAAARGTDAPVKPLGGTPDAIDVPPLDESDELVRQLVRKLSSHPAVAAWLATNGLIRNFTAVVSNVADGRTAAAQLAVLRPSTRFSVVERGGNFYIDPKSYDRYNLLAEAVVSLDRSGSARLYATLKPRIEEAQRELGISNTQFDRTLERALLRLLQTPVVDDPIRVEPLPKGIGYRFVDPRLEELSGPQKQLLRMGPRNQRMVQAGLREIAVELGVRVSNQ